ncbi:hypothetical protein FPOA_03885 [Fusarium poae]|uniref:Heterokaryon incompatibility domain-containing protein n=1 Tax=Fusarium poae TaxID=36050 RepID=A0A1B8ASG7_FUSPO|nr:hypothetical protein FPOA_03885 [Fusarium poae]
MPHIPVQPVGCLDKKEQAIRAEETAEDTNEHENTKELVISWLARCIHNLDGKHDICNQGDNDYTPLRLLDVRHALENNIVLLVCRNEEDDTFEGVEYATLSYCRGPHAAEQNPMLVTQNLETWQTEGLSWDCLPKTFQDALKIASWLGLNWIWIDSMCIIQDSRSDWKFETKVMDEIYAGAKVNISADIGEDSQAGCFMQRQKTNVTSQVPEEECIGIADHTSEWVNSAPSLTRAWIHRERQSSRRIIHCTAKGMIWECCALDNAGFASGTIPRGSPFVKAFNGETKFQIQIAKASGRNLRSSKRRERLHMLWNSTCQDFANKAVSQASDLPYLLWGMAFQFHTLFNGEEFACGHWRSNLAESLTWWIPGVKPEHEEYLAPSWSWLSAGCPVQLPQLNPKRHKRAVVDILSISRAYESRPDNGFGKHAPGSSVSVHGFLRKLRFDHSGNEEGVITLSVVEEDEHGNPRIRRIGPSTNLNVDPAFRMSMDRYEKLPSLGLECYALFTTLQESANDEIECQRHLACILLEYGSVEHNGHYQYHTYKRIGTMDNISDLYSLKLRYQVAPTATIPEAAVLQDDIWALLSQYLSYNRRSVIRKFRKSGVPDESGYSTVEVSETDDSEWEEELWTSRPQRAVNVNENEEQTEVQSVSSEMFDESTGLPDDLSTTSEQEQVDDEAQRHHPELVDLRDIITRIHNHPSSGVTPITAAEDKEEVSHNLQQILSFESETVAYGVNIQEDPGAILYQFDDLLRICQKKYNVVPWLKQLESSVFIIA